MTHPTASGYTPVQRLFHWTIAAMIFFNLLLPDGMVAWHRIVRRGGAPTAQDISAANVHAYVGIAILVLAVMRLWLRLRHGAPAEPAAEPKIFRLAARLAHAGLYALIFAMPLTGMAAYYFGMNAVGSIHAEALKIILWALIAAHVVGALLHQFHWRTDVLRRMTIG